MRKWYAILLVLLLSFTEGFGQRVSPYRLRGEVEYNKGHYLKALKLLEKYEEEEGEDKSEEYLKRKSEVYFLLGRFDEAITTYIKDFEQRKDDINAKHLKRLVLRSSQPIYYDSLIVKLVDDPLEDLDIISATDTIIRYDVRPVWVLNTQYSEFGALDFGDDVFYSAVTDRFLALQNINTELTHYDVYSVSKKALVDSLFTADNYIYLTQEEKKSLDSIIAKTKYMFYDKLNSKYNDGPIAFTQEEVFLTVNEEHKKKDNGVYNLTLRSGLLSADSNLVYDEIEDHFFGRYFSPSDVGQITFNKKGDKACMAVKSLEDSTGSDLWFADKLDGGWSDPYRASDTINTKRDELFPFWADDDILYFSSDGRFSYGGLDIYSIDLKVKGAIPQSLGRGVNSPYDDFAFSIDSFGNGYLTSDRVGGRGADDIYEVHKKWGNIRITLLGSKNNVDYKDFNVIDDLDVLIDSIDVIEDSISLITHLPYGDYYFNHSPPVDTLCEKVELYQDTVDLFVRFPDISPDTLSVRFTNFCFDCDGMDEINQEKFDRIVEFLKLFPEIEVKVEGNTDMFGSTKYNEALGMRRATIMERWMREANVVNPIVKVTNGKRKLVSEVDHRLNRRVDLELFWPNDTARIELVSRSEERLNRDVLIWYDEAEKHDEILIDGYYIQVYHSNKYIERGERAAAIGLYDGFDILLFSKEWDKFDYFIDAPFRTAEEALEMIEFLNIKGKVFYLKK